MTQSVTSSKIPLNGRFGKHVKDLEKKKTYAGSSVSKKPLISARYLHLVAHSLN